MILSPLVGALRSTDKTATWVEIHRPAPPDRISRFSRSHLQLVTIVLLITLSALRRSGVQEASITMALDEKAVERQARIEREIDRDRNVEHGFGMSTARPRRGLKQLAALLAAPFVQGAGGVLAR
jgi:hypothetical protein